MISKLDDFLRDEYFKMKKMLEKYGIYEYGSEILLLILISKEDSLLNCLIKSDIERIINIIIDKHLIYDKTEIEEIIEKAYGVAIKDKLQMVGDEHLLYAIINDEDCGAYAILNELSINIDEIRYSVNNYFEFEDDEYLVNLSSLARLNKFNPFIGRQEYIDKVIRIINKKQKNNCMLIGSAGVGKSALVEGVVISLMKQDINTTVYRLELGVIIAGTRYRGDLEERLVEVIRKVKEEKAILFIDEIHNIMGGTKGDEAVNIANILKPILARSEIKCIGATTLEEYYEYIEKDKALARRFQNLFIPEATKEETLIIMKKIKHKYEEFYGIKYSQFILESIVSNCVFFPNRKFPDKAIDILDELGAYTVSIGLKKPRVKDIKTIVFENIGIKYNKDVEPAYKELLKVLRIFTLGMNLKKTIANIKYVGVDPQTLIEDIKNLFNIRDEAIINFDFELFDDYAYNYLVMNALKYPITCVVINNFEKGNYYYQARIKKIFETGLVYDASGRIISFRNAIFIIVSKTKKELIGFNEMEKIVDLEHIDLVLDDLNDVCCNTKILKFIEEMRMNEIEIVLDENFTDNVTVDSIMNNLDEAFIASEKKKYIITKEKGDILIKSMKISS